MGAGRKKVRKTRDGEERDRSEGDDERYRHRVGEKGRGTRMAREGRRPLRKGKVGMKERQRHRR